MVCPNADVKPWNPMSKWVPWKCQSFGVCTIFFKGNWIAGFEVISHENEGWCDWIAGHGDRCLSHSDDGVLVGVSNVHVTAAAESSVIWARQIRSKHEKWRIPPPKKMMEGNWSSVWNSISKAIRKTNLDGFMDGLEMDVHFGMFKLSLSESLS